MHFAISASYGPTDPTRAMLPFIFAASALQDGDTVTIDSRTSDAIAMALRFNAPIFTYESILNEVGFESDFKYEKKIDFSEEEAFLNLEKKDDESLKPFLPSP